MFRTGLTVSLAIGAALAFSGVAARGARHSDAPLIKQDPQANITDVYAFVGLKYNNASQRVLNVVVQVRPFSEPGDGDRGDCGGRRCAGRTTPRAMSCGGTASSSARRS